MATAATGLLADTWFKKNYGKYLSRIPTFGIIRDKVPFETKKRSGESYEEQIELELEHGFTKSTGIAAGNDAFTMDAPIIGGSKRITINSSCNVLRTAIGLRGAYASDGAPNEVAFRELTKNRVRSMWKSTNKRLELDMIYGQCSDTANGGSGGIGVIDTHTAGTAVFTITLKSWAPAIWAGMKGALLEIFAPADPPTNIRTHTGTAPTGYTGNVTQISGVDVKNRQITVTANMGGVDEPVPGDIIFLKNSRTESAWQEMIGLHRFCSQTSGTLLGIDTALYDQWQPNVKDAGGAVLSFDLCNELLGDAIGKGLEGEVTILTNPFQWAKIMTDLGGLRRIDYSQNTNKYVIGASEIEFHSANGKMKIIAHPYIKRAFSYITTIDNDDSYRGSDSGEMSDGDSNMGPFTRGGIVDVTFNRPKGLTAQTSAGPKFFYESNTEYLVELRCVYDQFLLCNAVGHQTMIHNLATA